jgi:peptidoglycan hydrolase CwlO-like protein
MRILLIWLMLGLLAPSAVYADELQRTEDGVKVAKDNYLNIPSDMQVRRVANNVITPEDDAAYIARKIEEQNKRLDEMNAKIQALDSRIKTVESKN